MKDIYGLRIGKLKGSLAVHPRHPNRTYPPGRVCTAEGCETRLSIYNKARFCWLHTPVEFAPLRTPRRRRTAA